MGIDDLGLVDESRVSRQLPLVREDEVNLLYVFRAEPILLLPLGILAVGVDKQDLVSKVIGLVLIED